jgi:hypothetical protein
MCARLYPIDTAAAAYLAVALHAPLVPSCSYENGYAAA